MDLGAETDRFLLAQAKQNWSSLKKKQLKQRWHMDTFLKKTMDYYKIAHFEKHNVSICADENINTDAS